MIDKLRGSAKAIVALIGAFIITQLPDIEVFAQDWIQSAVSAIFVAISVWLKANTGPEA